MHICLIQASVCSDFLSNSTVLFVNSLTYIEVPNW